MAIEKGSAPVALVTGGASGIGKGTAQAFARAGYTVVVSDRNDEHADALVETLREHGGDAAFVLCDVTQEHEVARLIEETVRRFGTIDAAFNNAGIGHAPFATGDLPITTWDQVIQVNLRGVFLCMRAELAVMRQAASGAIVNCASVLGLVGAPDLPAYVASKHGIVGLTKAAALDYARHGIRVNAVCPGVTLTDALDAYRAANPEEFAKSFEKQPNAQLVTTEDVGAAVVWLCAPSSRSVTGTTLSVDGGFASQ